jgi:carboxylesterase type B
VDIDVVVTGGIVRGGTEADLAVFRGIPYAAPAARFGAPVPVPVQAWDGVRGAAGSRLSAGSGQLASAVSMSAFSFSGLVVEA